MSHATDLAAVVAERSETLFGQSLDVSAFHISLLAGGTRQVYRAVPSAANLATVVVKVRSPRRGDDPHAAALQTEHEFAIHLAAYHTMLATGRLDHGVPRPLLALPDRGLLFMEKAPGQPVKQWMSGEWFRPATFTQNGGHIRRCGEWLYTFAVRAAHLPEVPTSAAAEQLLAAARANHHVYCLIGLSGASLAQRMLEQVRRRLTAYRIDQDRAAHIEQTFGAALSRLEGTRDLQGNVHGKYSIEDVLISPDRVLAIDLEHTARGSLYLDPAYFLYQLVMMTRWQPIGSQRRAAVLRAAFLSARAPAGELDEGILDAFVAYYLVNSLRPGGGFAGFTARSRASHWLEAWVRRS